MSSQPVHQEEAQTLHTILFKMGAEYYGLPVESIKEIIKPMPTTRFPKSPPFVEGIIDLRGEVLPIVNLRKMFGLEPVPVTEASRYIDVQLGRFRVGIIVDEVSEVMHIPVSQTEPAPPIIEGVDGRYLNGVARLSDKLVLLLNLDEIFHTWLQK